jgi:rod shape-determining protein MreC
MLKFFLRNFPRFFLALLLLVCVWVLVYRHSHPNSQHLSLKNLSMAVWMPVQKSVSWVITFPENTLNAVQELGHLRQEVNRLQMENQSLHLELSNHKSLEVELARLREVLQIKAKLPHSAKIARIIAHDPSTWNKSFIIDIGSEDGLTVDSPVITEQGVVGRIIDVAAKNSRVLLLTDTGSSVAGLDVRSRVSGVILGTGQNRLSFGYVNADEDIQPGDTIVSSGLGGVFPKGYPLGTVVKRTSSDNGLNTQIDVAPSVDFGVLDYVFVLPSINIFAD